MFFFCFFMFLYLASIFLFFWLGVGGGVMLSFYLFSILDLDVSLSFLFDCVSLGFFGSVSFISGLVFFYSNFYMDGTVDLRRFYWLVFGFVLSMFFLVFSGNFIMTMVGWDGLGLISFCLVIFYSNHMSLESGLVTVFSNRVGDVFFLSSFFFFFCLGSFSFDLGSSVVSLLFFSLIFLGAITKSAQAPFSAWLPAAMAAPTPVSSLVHSSTLVTAGVYVLLRFFYVYMFFSFSFLKIFFISTMLLAGLCAIIEKDFKKIVAMSTLSQLGLMLYVLSLGIWVLTFLHMVIHAFFKSMLFLSTGSLMSHLFGGQDSRWFGGNPFSFVSFLFFVVSCVCLSGFPFYIGFYSKDFIILGSSFGIGCLFYFTFLLGCIFTVLYSFRLVVGAFSSLYSSYSYVSFLENVFFVFSSVFLFMKGWLLGGLFYWSFLFDSLVFFEGFDVVVGLFLFFFGFFVFSTFSIFYRFVLYLYVIGFLRWFSSSGSSIFMSKFSFHKWDFSWLEMGGGQGVSLFLSSLNLYLSLLKLVSLGLLISFILFFSFCF
nr:NADH dehydrogenase subunit 5 [Oribatula sakamorii]